MSEKSEKDKKAFQSYLDNIKMVTHRVRITNPKEINAEVLAWLMQAYDAA